MTNFRCNKSICDLSNKLFPNFQATASGNNDTTEHSGVFLIKEQDIENYLQKFEPIQLRDSKRTNVNENYRVMNFGEAKGLSFDRVLIYPTEPFIKWLKDNNAELAETSRSKLYVAITRARHSVAIICKTNLTIDGMTNYNPNAQAHTFANHTKPTHRPKFAKECACQRTTDRHDKKKTAYNKGLA